MADAYEHRKRNYVRPRHNLVRRNHLLLQVVLVGIVETPIGGASLQTGTFTGADWGSLPATVEPLEPSERWEMDQSRGRNAMLQRIGFIDYKLKIFLCPSIPVLFWFLCDAVSLSSSDQGKRK
ncbi:hypothetical protein U1Q18_003979 [Sarracenia purpurea var. burkii]